MNVLKKRPLSIILCIALGGFSFFVNASLLIRLSAVFVSALIFISTFVFPYLFKGSIKIVRICAIVLSIAVMLGLLWSALFYPHADEDKPTEIYAKVYEIDNSDSVTSTLILKTTEINGDQANHKIRLYIDKSEAVKIRKYDVIRIYATLKSIKSLDNDDVRVYYASEGISATASYSSNLEIITNDKDRLDSTFREINKKVCSTLKLRTNFETGSLLSALIMGNRSDLDGNTRLNFKRIGISHILALSGMHLAILSGVISRLLHLLGVAKKPRVLTVSILAIGYICITGFSPSVVRSGTMLIIASLLFLLTRKADAITSLLISVTLIVIITPHAVFDISLWLSAFATFGVIAFSELKPSYDKKNKSFIRNSLFILWQACLVSIFAVCATIIFTGLYFKHFSLFFAVATIVFGVLAELLIIGALLVLAVGWLLPVGKPIIWLSDITKELAEAMSDCELAQISLKSPISQALVITLCILFYAFLILDIKNKRTAILLILTVFGATLTSGAAETIIARNTDDLIYSASASGDVFLMKSDRNITVVYSGKSRADDAQYLSALLFDENINYVDSLVLPSYSYSMIDFCIGILNTAKVERILLPTPKTDDEIDQATGLADRLSVYGACLVFYDAFDKLVFGEFEYQLFQRNDYKYGEYPENVFTIKDDENKYTYLSACDYDRLSTDSRMLLYQSEQLFIGTIGNVKYYLFDMILPDINSVFYGDKGRLDDDAKLYYKEKGASTVLVETPISIWD